MGRTVTDPALIAQLESGGNSKVVTDPNLIAQLENGAQPQMEQPQGNPSLPFRITGNIAGGLANAGQELANFPARVGAMLANAGQAIPQLLGVPGATHYDFNKMFGLDNQPNTDYAKVFGVNNPNVADKIVSGAAGYLPYLAGGEAAALPKVAESIPGLASKVPWLNKIVTANLNQAPVDFIYGATQSKNPIEGATEATAAGRAIGIPLSVLGKGGNAAWENKGNLFSFMRPQKHAEEMLNTLGGGKGLEENAKSFAGDLSNAFKRVNGEVADIYNPIFNKYGNTSIYKDINPEVSSYNSLDKDALAGYDRNLNKLHEKFTSNPSLQNAHDLQSQLGSSIRKLQASDAKGNLSVSDRSKLQGYQDARDAVRTDINSFLKNENPAFANQYNAATQKYAERVAPYLDDPKIAQIAKGELTNPKNLSAIFKNPEPEVQQVIGDIGQGANNKILYDTLGRLKSNLTPEKLASAIGNLDKQGLSSYVTPEFTKQADALTSKINTKKGVSTIASAVTGGALGHSLGIPFGETLGVGAGLAASPIVNSIARILPASAAREIPMAATNSTQKAIDNHYLSETIKKLLRGAPAVATVDAVNQRSSY